MKNPFAYGGVVGGAAFCNREREVADLQRAMENHDKLFVFSERRYGKTSLVRRALGRLPKKGHVCAYVDLWPTDSEAGFVAAMAKALTEAAGNSMEQIWATAKRFFGSLSPSVTMDEDGQPAVSFGINPHAKLGPTLDEVLDAPAKFAANGKAKVVVVFDEFQQILEYGDDRVERKLRSMIQHHSNVSYLFLGSRKHLIQKMILGRSRPLYRAGGHYPLGPIAEQHWQPFISKRFNDAGKVITPERVQEICRLTEGHPFYTQHLCHVVWELCESPSQVTEALLREAVRVLLEREDYSFTTQWESFTGPQQRLLKGLASEPPGAKVYGGEFVQRHGLGSASSVQRATQALLDRDVIDREKGSFLVTDRFFRLWIKQAQAR